jgi:hypothetical protein
MMPFHSSTGSIYGYTAVQRDTPHHVQGLSFAYCTQTEGLMGGTQVTEGHSILGIYVVSSIYANNWLGYSESLG